MRLFYLKFALITLFMIIGCSNTKAIDNNITEFEIIAFDAVSKKIVYKNNIPNFVKDLTNKWFNERVKVSGIDGELIFTVKNYVEEISNIADGKRVDTQIKFEVKIYKNSLSQIKTIDGIVYAFSTISGDFSLNDLDQLIQNTQIDLISRLSIDLKTKI